MLTALKRQWHSLERGKPGQRFEARYQSARRNRRNATTGDRVLRFVHLLAALALIAIGVVLVFIPGPAILFFFLGGGLLASESKYVARFMDWSEVHVRTIVAWLKKHWLALPAVGKVVVGVLVAVGGAGAAFMSYRMIAG